MAGIAALEWCGLTSPPAIVVFITVWTLFCCFSRRSAVYGECAVVAALTAPIIMLGPVAGEQGAMLRVEQTVLGCLIYSFIDNLFYPVRAKLDLRRELVASLDAFRELWTSAFGVFLEEEGGSGGGGGEEGRAKAQASHARLMVRGWVDAWMGGWVRGWVVGMSMPSDSFTHINTHIHAHPTGELREPGALHFAGPRRAGALA